MIIKYGKAVDMKKLNRDLDAIRENIEIARTDSERFYCVSDCKFPPQCRICGGGAKHFVQIHKRYDYYECNECGTVFLQNLPNIKKCIAIKKKLRMGIYT